MRTLLISLALLLAAGCSQKSLIDHLSSSNEQRWALSIAQQLRGGDLASIAQQADPQFRPQLAPAVAAVRPVLLQAKGPFTIEGVQIVRREGAPALKAFTVEIGSGSHWAVAEIVAEVGSGRPLLVGFHAFATDTDPTRLNDFDATRRGILGYIWLLAMAVCATICVAAVSLIWRRPWLHRRWLWTLGSLFGFVGLGINWSNGTMAVLFLNISLLGASATKTGPFAPWILTFGIPVIAMIVIVRWLRLGASDSSAR